MKYYALTAAAVLLTFSGAASAADIQKDTQPEHMPEKVFKQLDQNQNGTIEPQEASQHQKLAQGWTEADTDQNGSVDMQEFLVFTSEATAAGQPESDS